MSFVHLHLHTEYAIVDSIISIGALCQEAKKQEMSALAITDVCNLFGMVKFYRAAFAQQIKPIIGAELWVESEIAHFPYHRLVLLCQDQQGYRNLTRLVTQAYVEGKRDAIPLVKKQWLKANAAGLIALSGAQFGEIGQILTQQAALKAGNVLKEWMALFPNRFYLEIQRNNRSLEKQYENQVLPLANELKCPVVATNEVVFLKKSDFDAHKARVCIQEGITLEQSKSERHYSEEQYLKTADEMQALFSDLPQAIENTVEIAKRCTLALSLDQPVLPSFPVPEKMTEETFLEKKAKEGLEKRLAFKKEAASPTLSTDYQKRLSQELDVINAMGFPGYFLIVADFIQWAKSNHIPVGPGRGSGAGSLVAYALSITDIDPMEYDLLFERFLNPERVSMPDFDIDFCMDNRDQVIEYVAKRYGRDSVSQIATFGTMAAKAVIRDVGRVLGYPYGFVDKLAKLIPFELGITLDKALEKEPVLNSRYQDEEEVRTLIDLAKKLEGIARNVGKHAGGVVIAPSQLTDYAPLYYEQDSAQAVIQFDKDDVESIGLVKFDFLGLRTLTIIDWAVKNANKLLKAKGLAPIEIERIALDDSATFNFLKQCKTTAVFQLESRGMKELIKRLQPDQFEEIIALVALFRPGPLQSGMVDDFINRKHGRAQVVYPHPAVASILKSTYGVILYQEQVMQIAQELAGYTLGEADLLRRAMGKKKPEEMAKQRTVFVKSAVKRGVEQKVATYIFDLMEKFAGYGFNKSHSAAYALVAYQTAWLKTHFPSSFMAAVLSADMSHTDKVLNMIEECRQCQIKVIPPHIALSEYAFTVNEQDEIVYGLGAIKGVGEAAIHHILAQRQKGPFRDLYHFCRRVDGKKVNKRVIESLIKSGTFDCFGSTRAHLLATMDLALKGAEQQAKALAQKQGDLFADFATEEVTLNVQPWTTKQLLQGEKESLGLYLSGHPLESMETELARLNVEKFRQIGASNKERKVRVAGLIIGVRTMQTKNGDRMAIVSLDDRIDRIEVTVFPKVYQLYRENLVKDQLLIVEGNAVLDTYTGGMKILSQSLYTLKTAREQFAKAIKITLGKAPCEDTLNTLKGYLTEQQRGNCALYLVYQNKQAQLKIKFADKWKTSFSEALLNKIQTTLNPASVEIDY